MTASAVDGAARALGEDLRSEGSVRIECTPPEALTAVFKSGRTAVLTDAKLAEGTRTVPDTVALIIWLIAGVAAGNATGELLKGNYDLGPGNTVTGAIGGIIGALILQTLIPALAGFDLRPILSQVIVAAACGAGLTIMVATVRTRRRRRH